MRIRLSALPCGCCDCCAGGFPLGRAVLGAGRGPAGGKNGLSPAPPGHPLPLIAQRSGAGTEAAACPCRPPGTAPRSAAQHAAPGAAMAPLVLYHWTQSFSSQKVRGWQRRGAVAASPLWPAAGCGRQRAGLAAPACPWRPVGRRAGGAGVCRRGTTGGEPRPGRRRRPGAVVREVLLLRSPR